MVTAGKLVGINHETLKQVRIHLALRVAALPRFAMSPERSECMPASCGLRHPSRRDHAGEGREARQDPAVEPRRRWADAEIRAAASAAYKSLLFPAGLRLRDRGS